MESLESALALLLEHAGHPDGSARSYAPCCRRCIGRVAAEDVAAPVPGAALRPFAAGWLRPAQRGHRRGQPGATPRGFSVIGEACAGCGEVFAPCPGARLCAS